MSTTGRVESRWFWPCTVVLLAVMGTVQVTSALQENNTWDEAIHLSAGYAYLKTGDFRMNAEHPPLGKLLTALPLLWFDPALPTGQPGWDVGAMINYGRQFLYSNRVPADTLLMAGRSVTILLTLLLGLALALWTRRHFGAPAALFALFLFSFDPNLIAHGRYVTTDFITALTFFLSCVSWAAYLESRKTRHLLLAGLALGLAVTSKFSMLILVALLPALYLIRWWQDPKRLSLARGAASLAVVLVIAGAVVLALYRMPPGPHSLVELVGGPTQVEKLIRTAVERLGVPLHPYLVGLVRVAQHGAGGHPGYLLGQISERGWWYYFPVVFLVKTPTAVLALCGLCAGLVLFLAGRIRELRRLPFAWFVLTLPPACYFLACTASPLDLGVRHILPVYPFLFVFLAGILFRVGRERLRRWFPAVVAVALVGLAVESLAIYPHYLAFFNAAVGGPKAGPRYLLDSNIDWGQDLKKLKAYMIAHDIPRVCALYFGNALFHYYGVDVERLPRTEELEQRRNLDCVAAASVTPLYGLYSTPASHRWLREIEPMARIGYSIYLYDLRQPRPPSGQPPPPTRPGYNQSAK